MHSKSPSGIPIPVLKIANGKIVTGSTPPNTPRQATWITDAHFHATNYTQQGYKPAQLLTAMDELQIRYTVLSPIPTNQIACCSSKTYRPAHGVANDQPDYYIYDPDVRAARFVTAEVYKYIIKQSPSLVYNTGVDAYTAVSYGVLPDKDKDRFDPMVTGLVLGDDRASDDLMFKMEAFPGVFTGVGEITVHKEWVERKLSGDVQANLKDRAPALKFLFQTCGDIGMPVILHCDADVMPHERTKDTPEHEVSLKELMGDPMCQKTTIVWAHAGGLGKYSRIRPGHLDRMRKVFEDPALKHVRIDISWDTVAEQLIFKPEDIQRDEEDRLAKKDRKPLQPDPAHVKDLVAFIEAYPDRVLFGSDSLAPNSEAIWNATHVLYEESVFKALKPETRRKVQLGNYVDVFVAARAKVRRYEKFVLPYAVIPLQMRQDNALPKVLLERVQKALQAGVKYGYDCIAYETQGGKPVTPGDYPELISAEELEKVAIQIVPKDGKDLSRLYLGPYEKELRPLISGPKAKL